MQVGGLRSRVSVLVAIQVREVTVTKFDQKRTAMFRSWNKLPGTESNIRTKMETLFQRTSRYSKMSTEHGSLLYVSLH